MRLLLSLVLLFPLVLRAQSDFRVVKLLEGLDHPWSLAFLPDGRMLVTERPGRLSLIGRDFKRSHIEGVPRVYASGQGGLLEVALHPRFAENRLIYLSYAGPGEGGASTELACARLNGGPSSGAVSMAPAAIRSAAAPKLFSTAMEPSTVISSL